MASTLELNVHRTLEACIITTKAFLVSSFLQFAMLTTALQCLIWGVMEVIMTVVFWRIQKYVSVLTMRISVYQSLQIFLVAMLTNSPIIFHLKPWLLRGYPDKNLSEENRIYNYTHSRARRTIENTFGILSARWRIFSTSIRSTVAHAEEYVLATIALHNYLRQTSNASYTPAGFIDSESSDGSLIPEHWRNEVVQSNESGSGGCLRRVNPVRGSRVRADAIEIRRALTDYLRSDVGSVEWQLEYVRRTEH